MTATEAYWADIYATHSANLVKRFGLDRVWQAMSRAITTRPYCEERYKHAVQIRMAIGED